MMIGYLESGAKFAITLISAWLLASGPAQAQRAITVNGQWLTPQQMIIADSNAGFVLPNGHYWCNPANGFWGPLGGNAIGRVHPSQCPPLPNRVGGQPNIRRGPGGNTGGDGSCFYYNDPQTGASVMTGNC